MHGDSSSYSARFHSQLRSKDWALYAEDSWRITRDSHSTRRAIRALRRSAQRRSRLSIPILYYGSGSSIFEQIHNGYIATGPNSPIRETLEPRVGTLARVSASAYDVFGDGRRPFAVATHLVTKGLRQRHVHIIRTTQQCHGLG